jgi:hypothetical protein
VGNTLFTPCLRYVLSLPLHTGLAPFNLRSHSCSPILHTPRLPHIIDPTIIHRLMLPAALRPRFTFAYLPFLVPDTSVATLSHHSCVRVNLLHTLFYSSYDLFTICLLDSRSTHRSHIFNLLRIAWPPLQVLSSSSTRVRTCTILTVRTLTLQSPDRTKYLTHASVHP